MKPVRLLLPCLLLLLSSFAPHARANPQAAAPKLLDRFLTAMNTGEETAWREFIANHWAPPPPDMDSDEALKQRLNVFQVLHGELGHVRLHEIVKLSDSDIVALAQGMAPIDEFDWIRIHLWLTPDEPYKVRMLGADGADDPTVVVPEGEITAASIKPYMDAKLDDLVARDAFSGTVLIAKDGRPIYTYVAGEANKRYHAPNRLDTKFNLGSMNKMFTGVAIGQLAEQGKLSFQDKVGQHLPDYPNRRVRDEVTIHQLLTHTSGLGDYFQPLFDSQYWTVRSVAGYASLFENDTLLFDPGERFQYSNAGPVLLGLIIEKITGRDYHDYIRDHVTGPAGMTNTDCYEIDRPVEKLAIGYTKYNYEFQRTDQWRSNLFMHSVKGGPAGGGYSTVEDLLKFAQALREGTILSPAYVDTVITGKVDTWENEKYAYLFLDANENGHRIVGHGGGAPGISAKLDIYWGEPYTVCVMSNYGGAAIPIADHARRALAQ